MFISIKPRNRHISQVNFICFWTYKNLYTYNRSMSELMIALITFIISSSYVIIVDYLSISPQIIQKSITLPILLFLILIFFYRKTITSWREILNHGNKYLLLFFCTTFLQLLVLSTGGIYSPFLILIYILMVG